jgi:hypothetical protein
VIELGAQASKANGAVEHLLQTFEQATLRYGIHRRALSHTGTRAGLHQESYALRADRSARRAIAAPREFIIVARRDCGENSRP